MEKNKAVDVTIGTVVSYEELLKAVAFQNPLKKDPGKDTEKKLPERKNR